MAGPNRTLFSDIRGSARLAFEALAGLTTTVEDFHHTIERKTLPFGAPPTGRTRGTTGLVYAAVRSSMRLAGLGIDAALAPVTGLLPEGETSARREAIVSAINGVAGDYLQRTENPLALDMRLRYRGQALEPETAAAQIAEADGTAAGPKLLVLIHGLCMNDLQWRREGHDHGAALASALGYTPLYLRYNTGLPIAQNGRAFSDLLERLVAHWPGRLEELTIMGHSMGGLVARSAHNAAGTMGHRWPERLRRLVFLGTPHHGAPLERGGRWLEFLSESSPYLIPITRLSRMRSAGIGDLAHGTITEGAHAHVPLPAGVACYTAAATLGIRPTTLGTHLTGDGLVPLNSALGRHSDPALTLGFPKNRQWVGYEMDHFDLLSDPGLCQQLCDWLA